MLKYFILLNVFLLTLGASSCSTNEKNSLSENLNQDSVAYTTVEDKFTYGSCDDTTSYGASRCSELIVSHPVFSGTAFADLYTATAMEQILHMPFDQDSAETLQELSEKFFAAFEEVRDVEADFPVAWFSQRTAGVSLNSFPLLSIEVEVSEYLGGAHPNSYVFMYVFDTRTGTKIQLSDIIEDDKLPLLKQRAEVLFRKLKELPPTEDLSERFFFDKDIFQLSAQFSLQFTGIMFFYNNYEIGPYAEGTTELFVPYVDIMDLLKPNSPLSVFLDRTAMPSP